MPQTYWLYSDASLLSYSSWSQSSQQCPQDWVTLEALGENAFPYFFQLVVLPTFLGSRLLPQGAATHSSISSCLGNPMNRGAWGRQSRRQQRIGHYWACTHTVHSSFCFRGLILSPMSTLVLHWVHLDNSGQSPYLKIFNNICHMSPCFFTLQSEVTH